MSKSDPRQVKPKKKFDCSIWSYYKNLQTVIRNNLHILHSDPEMKNLFPEDTINVTYKIGKSLRELIFPSVFPEGQIESHSIVSKCKSRRWYLPKLFGL